MILLKSLYFDGENLIFFDTSIVGISQTLYTKKNRKLCDISKERPVTYV